MSDEPDAIEHWMYATGEMVRIPVRARLAQARSKFQELLVVDTERFGRCLLIDGVMQTSDLDHTLYDDALLARVGPGDRRILVLGGGDGYVALRAVERWPDLHVVLVEIDPEVLALAERWLNPGLRDHPRIEVVIGDGLAYAREAAARAPGSFCGVALDLTDAPVDPSRARGVEALYAEMTAATLPLVRPGGWFSVQAGAPEVADGGLHLPTLLEGLLAPHLERREQVSVDLPSYGEPNVFVLGSRPPAPPVEVAWWHDAGPSPSHRHAFKLRSLARAGRAEVLEHERLGRVLAVGGAARFIEADPAYVELAAHVPLAGRARQGARVLLLGGDDGRLALEALRHDVAAVTLVADPAALDLARRWLPEARALGDRRLEVVATGDAAALARAGRFDVAIADLFADPALDPSDVLAPGGVYAAAAPCALRSDGHGVVPTRAWRRGAGPESAFYVAGVPLAPGGFVAFRLDGPDAAAHATPATSIEGRHYTPALHRAVFALPTWWKGGLRELPPEPTPTTAPATWWHEHDGGTAMSQALDLRRVHHERSPFQQIDVYDHAHHGRVLVLDDTVQGSVADEAIYHELAVHVPLLSGPRPRRRVLIVGGGDLGAVREALRHPWVERVVLVEIDARVIDVSRRLFPLLDGPDDPRLETHLADAAAWLHAAVARGERFDCVIIDATDSTEPSQTLFTDGFYADLRACLAEGGVCVDSDIVHAGLHGAQLSRDRPGRPLADLRRARSVFGSVEGYMSRLPLYPGGMFAFFVYGAGGSCAEPRERFEGRFYNPEVHRAAFALPAWWARELARA